MLSSTCDPHPKHNLQALVSFSLQNAEEIQMVLVSMMVSQRRQIKWETNSVQVNDNQCPVSSFRWSHFHLVSFLPDKMSSFHSNKHSPKDMEDNFLDTPVSVADMEKVNDSLCDWICLVRLKNRIDNVQLIEKAQTIVIIKLSLNSTCRTTLIILEWVKG